MVALFYLLTQHSRTAGKITPVSLMALSETTRLKGFPFISTVYKTRPPGSLTLSIIASSNQFFNNYKGLYGSSSNPELMRFGLPVSVLGS